MITVKFSHYYPKMPKVTELKIKPTYLVGVSICDIEKLPIAFLEWDTLFDDLCHYPLPAKGKFIVLTLFDPAPFGRCWTTIRRAMPFKIGYYASHIGEQVNIEIVKEAENE